MRPVLIFGAERLSDQQAAETGAVDEEVGLDLLTALQRHRGDVAILVHADIDDLAFGPLHAVLLGEAAQIFRIKRSVEVEGVRDMTDRRISHVRPRMHELVLERRGAVDREIGEVAGTAALVRPQPVMVAAEPFPVLADDSERVDVAVAFTQPVDELDAELERGLAALHELGFVELDQLIVFLDRRDRRFADADGADRFAFDQLEIVEALEQFAEQGGGHPTRSTAANDENPAHGQVVSGYRRGRPRSAALQAAARAWSGSRTTSRSRGGTGCHPAAAGNRPPASRTTAA